MASGTAAADIQHSGQYLASDPCSGGERYAAKAAADLSDGNHYPDNDSIAAGFSGSRNLSAGHRLCYLRNYALLVHALPEFSIPSGVQLYAEYHLSSGNNKSLLCIRDAVSNSFSDQCPVLEMAGLYLTACLTAGNRLPQRSASIISNRSSDQSCAALL